MTIAYTTHLIRYAMDEKNDCTVRALATATGMAYDKAHEVLKEHGRRARTGVRITPLSNAYKAVMGVEQVKMTGRPTLHRFVQDHTTGTLIVRLSNHVFVLKDGVQYDMQKNGERRRVLGYWLVPNPHP
ncbi:hypothetical protein UFOVP229_35 [uncultured Caudovirales phage]|uniref:Uncharacterized protein n=1 Tax=uncultured Caudovirales phage TaxID=2100421 RepID=A0A6J7WN22_9CAUD|nr:hypothetical protein UFOVP229_35 [uncultured Caudovirales phage]